MTNREKSRVAVIGAGVAGLSLGRMLTAAGIDVTLFEKSRGPGGRLASKRVADGGVDIGAQYFTVRHPEFRELLDRTGAIETLVPWTGTLVYEQPDGKEVPFTPEERWIGSPRMTALSRSLSKGLEIHHETRITRVWRDDHGWNVESSDGSQWSGFDRLVVSAPPVQSRDLLGEFSAIHGALQAFDLMPTWAVALGFESSLGLSFEGYRPRHDVLGWVACNSAKPGRKNEDSQYEWWVLHGNPDWSYQNRNAEAAWVTRTFIQAFRDRFEVATEPAAHVAHRWLYAQQDPTVQAPQPGCITGEQESLGVIGDWLAGGRVEGAWLSARALVKQWWPEAAPEAGKSG